MEIIGLTGAAQSGKNTVAEILAEEYGGKVDQTSFADLIKVSSALALGLTFHPDAVGTEAIRAWADRFKTQHTIQVLDEGDNVIHQITGRQFLQRYGTEAHRDLFGENFWIDAMNFHDRDCDLLIITDVRFSNEAAEIRTEGGKIWQVTRYNQTSDSHVSERPLDSRLIDVAIPNYGSISDLRGYVKMALAEYSRLV